MSNVIDFLERVGQDARLRQDLHGEVALALANEEIDPELRAAILSKDQPWIDACLGQGQLCCLLVPGEENEEEDENSEETPSREGEETSQHSLFPASAFLG